MSTHRREGSFLQKIQRVLGLEKKMEQKYNRGKESTISMSHFKLSPKVGALQGQFLERGWFILYFEEKNRDDFGGEKWQTVSHNIAGVERREYWVQ